MEIGFFSDSYFPEIDGVTYTLKTWKERLEERGHNVYIVYPGNPGYEAGENEIPVRSVPNPFYNGYRIPFPAGADYPDLDIVHCHSPAFLGISGRLYAYRNDIPAVYTHHTPLEEYVVQAVKSEFLASLVGKIYVPLENFFLETFDVFTCSTGDDNRSPEKIRLPVGVDMDFFTPSSGDMFDGEETVLGYSGRLSDEKNVSVLTEFAEDFDGKLVIVGEGPEKQRLVDEAPDNVEFRDWLDREQLPVFYSSLDLFLTASTGDTLGLSTLEANACGTPVIAPEVHPFNKTIREENGLRFSPGDTSDLQKKVEEALGKKFSCRKAVEKYSLEKTIDRLEEIYGELRDAK